MASDQIVTDILGQYDALQKNDKTLDEPSPHSIFIV